MTLFISNLITINTQIINSITINTQIITVIIISAILLILHIINVRVKSGAERKKETDCIQESKK